MVNSLSNTAQQLKGMIEHAKLQAEAAKDAAITQVKLQAEAEKKEVSRCSDHFLCRSFLPQNIAGYFGVGYPGSIFSSLAPTGH